MSIYLAAETNTTIGNSSLAGAGFKCELGRKEMCDLKIWNTHAKGSFPQCLSLFILWEWKSKYNE